MTFNEAYHSIRNDLCSIYDEREAANIASMVVEKTLGLNRMERLKHKDDVLSPLQEEQLKNHTDQLLQHCPVQYVLQEAWFYGMPLHVNNNVLIPRPETEELVEWIVKDEKNRRGAEQKKSLILDIGTGSGCIAIALQKSLPEANVTAIDVSEKALEVARRNARDQQLALLFLNVDFLDNKQSNRLPQFDIIVSNPPYVPLKDKTDIRQNVLNFEPHTALFVEDENPLVFYEAIADFALQHLEANGCVYMEIHESMGDAIRLLFNRKGYSSVEVRKDMQGRDRMVKVRRIS